MLDTNVVTALAAICGSVVGGLASFATTYVTQRHQISRERIARELERREAVYVDLIEQAGDLFADSLDKHLEDLGRLVRLAATLGRVRLISDREVVEAADNILTAIVRSYERPAVMAGTFLEETNQDFREPMLAFAEACRRERESILRKL